MARGCRTLAKGSYKEETAARGDGTVFFLVSDSDDVAHADDTRDATSL